MTDADRETPTPPPSSADSGLGGGPREGNCSECGATARATAPRCLACGRWFANDAAWRSGVIALCVVAAISLAATVSWVPYRRYVRAGPWQVLRGDDGVAWLDAGGWKPADAAVVAGYRPSWWLAREWGGPAGDPRAKSIVVAGEFTVWFVVVIEQALILTLASAVGVRMRRAWRAMARVR